jgi:hypothetical protein
MFNLKSSDPLDGLLAAAEGIISERAALLETIAKAETRLGEAEAGLAVAEERVAGEEFEAAQKEGGLAVASKAAQQALAEAELKTKSARFRLQGLQPGLKPIDERLLAAWASVQKYRQDFIRDKIETLSEEFDETLKALVRLVCKARIFRSARLKFRPRGFFHPGAALARFWISNPLAGSTYIDGQFVRDADRMRDSIQHPEMDPEALALRDTLQGVEERVMRLGAALKEAGVAGVDLKPQGGGETVEEEETHVSE